MTTSASFGSPPGAFTLEGNRFCGVTDKDEIAKAFRGSVQMTARRDVFEPAWKAWFDGIK